MDLSNVRVRKTTRRELVRKYDVMKNMYDDLKRGLMGELAARNAKLNEIRKQLEEEDEALTTGTQEYEQLKKKCKSLEGKYQKLKRQWKKGLKNNGRKIKNLEREYNLKRDPLTLKTEPGSTDSDNESEESQIIKTNPNKHAVLEASRKTGPPRCICGKIFANKKNLRYHVMNFSGQLMFPCSRCDKRFVTGSTLRTHEKEVHKIVHPNRGLEECSCSKCGVFFQTRAELAKHQRMRHSSQNNA